MIHSKIKRLLNWENIFGEMKWRLKFLLFWIILFSLIIVKTKAQPGSGNAIDFDGFDDNIHIDDDGGVLLPSTMTAETWFSLNAYPSSGTSGATILSKYDNFTNKINDVGGYLLRVLDDGTIRLAIVSETINVLTSINYSSPLNLNQYYHVAFTYSSSSFKLYLNGVEVDSNNSPVTMGFTTNNLEIGRLSDRSRGLYPYGYFNGQIDEVRIWNTVRTEAQIRDNMCKTLSGNESGLVGYWQMDEGTGTSISDVTTNGHNGTLQGTNGSNNLPQWQTSGVPLGDESTQAYGNGSSTELTLNFGDGSNISFDHFNIDIDGAHIYIVNEAPNATTIPTDFSSLETSRYIGLFTVGGTEGATLTYNYSGNSAITGASNESTIRLLKRDDNTDLSWTRASNQINTNVSSDVLKAPGQTSGEFLVGFNNETPLLTPPGSGTSISFNEAGGAQLEYISFPDNDAFNFDTEDFTIEFWFKSGSNPAAGGADFIINKYGSGFNNGWTIILEDNSPEAGRIGLFTNNGVSGEYGLVYTQEVLTDNQWHHVACFRSGDNLDIYVDGMSGVSQADPGRNTGKDNDDFSNNLPLGIAARLQPSSTGYTTCELDEIRIWKSALSLSEIRNWMTRKITTQHPQFDNLTGLIRFDQGSGSTVATNWIDESTGNIVNLDVNNDWKNSGVPLGDDSFSEYGSGSSTNLTLSYSNGSSVNATNFNNDIDGAHVYIVNEAPNITTIPSGFSALETSQYFGLYTIGGTEGATITYSYSGNTAITAASNEANSRLLSRDDNADQSWAQISYLLQSNTSSNSIKVPDVQTGEYMVGFSNTTILSTPPGSGTTLTFDGANDWYVDVGGANSLDIVNDGTSWSYVSWVYINSLNESFPIIINQGSNSGGGVTAQFRLGDTGSDLKPVGFINHSGGTNKVIGSTDLSTGQWHHLALTFDGSVMKVYVNGIEDGNANITGTFSDGGHETIIARRMLNHASLTQRFDGHLDEIQMWKTDLSTTEIQDWMNRKITNEHPQFNHLVAYFRLDEGNGNASTTNWVNESSATVENININTNWVTSGAPVGDNISNLFNASGIPASSSINISPTNRGTMTATVAGGSPTSLVIYYIDESPNVTTIPSGLTSFDGGYFGVKVFGGTSPTYNITYDYTNNDNVDDVNDPRIATRSDNSASSWIDLGATLNATNNTLTFTGLSGTEFIPAGGDGGTPLPVSWLHFEALQITNAIELVWKTGQEIDNDHFEVERSKDGHTYTSVGNLNGNGNTNGVSIYRFIDYKPFFGDNHYRIKQVDFDGGFDYSKTIFLWFQNQSNIRLSPNPSSGNIKITGFSKKDSNLILSIIDLTGQTVERKSVEGMTGEIDLKLKPHILSGVYLVTLEGKGFKTIQKLIVNR